MSSDPRDLRPLLPRPEEPATRAQPPTSIVGPAVLPALPRRRSLSISACETCRRRKSKCDARRPKCSSCASHGWECVYITEPAESRTAAVKRRNHELEEQLRELRESHDTLSQLIRALKTLDDATAATVLQQLRQGADLRSLVQNISAGTLLLQLRDTPAPTRMEGIETGEQQQEQQQQQQQQRQQQQQQQQQHGREEEMPLAVAEGEASAEQGQGGTMPGRTGQPSPSDELFQLLGRMSEDRATRVLHYIRQNHSVADTLRIAKEADLRQQLSLVPSTQRRYQFPHSSAFPRHLRTPDSPYLDSIREDSPPQECVLDINARATGFVQTQPYQTPFHASRIVHPYLWGVRASRWTSVTDSDVLVSQLLHSYLLHQYPIYLGFQKDDFLEDMAKGRDQFCSSLLVNAILAAGCRTLHTIPGRADPGTSRTLSCRFRAEAERLWKAQVQKGRSSLTAIQAAVVLGGLHASDGIDSTGRSYMVQAVAMAHDMTLFAAHPSRNENRSARMQRSRDVTAWSLYSWDSMQSFYGRQDALLTAPPDVPLPGLDGGGERDWRGDIWVLYPLSNKPTPTHLQESVRATMQLRLIQHEVTQLVSGSEKPPGVTTAEKLDLLCDRLDHWFDQLPAPFRNQNIVLPSHFRIHMEYYMTLLTIIQLRNSATSSPLPKETRSDGTGSTDDAHRMARAYGCLETLVRLYYIRHSSEIYDPFLTLLFFLLGHRALETLQSGILTREATRDHLSALILCGQGLHDQARSSKVSHVAFRALRDRMGPRETNLLMAHVTDDTRHGLDTRNDDPHVGLPCDNETIVAMVASLANGYRGLSLG